MKPQFLKLMEWFNPLQPGVAYLYPLTTSENLEKQHRAVMAWDSLRQSPQKRFQNYLTTIFHGLLQK